MKGFYQVERVCKRDMYLTMQEGPNPLLSNGNSKFSIEGYGHMTAVNNADQDSREPSGFIVGRNIVIAPDSPAFYLFLRCSNMMRSINTGLFAEIDSGKEDYASTEIFLERIKRSLSRSLKKYNMEAANINELKGFLRILKEKSDQARLVASNDWTLGGVSPQGLGFLVVGGEKASSVDEARKKRIPWKIISHKAVVGKHPCYMGESIHDMIGTEKEEMFEPYCSLRGEFVLHDVNGRMVWNSHT